jgi:hypothetical protein
MKVLLFSVWMCIANLITALVGAGSFRLLWGWFLARDYGSGPSLGAWYGASMIAGLIVYAWSPRRVDESDSELGKIVNNSVGMWLFFGLALAVARCVGWCFGWLP